MQDMRNISRLTADYSGAQCLLNQARLCALQDGQADYTQMLADTRTSGTAGVEVVLPSVTPMAWDNYVVFYKARAPQGMVLASSTPCDLDAGSITSST